MTRALLALGCIATCTGFCEVPCRIRTVVGSLDASEGDGGPATQARLYAPASVAVDRAGNLVIADPDNHRVRRVAENGIITTIAGTGTAGFDAEGAAAAARLRAPQGVAFDGAGNLYVADTGNFRVRTIPPDGTIRSSFQLIVTGTRGRPFPADPHGIAIDSSGNAFVSSPSLGSILRVAPNGAFVTIVRGLRQPTGLALDSAGNLYIAETGDNRIVKRTPDGNILTLSSGAGIRARARAVPTWNAPEGLAIDGRGNLYVSDTGNHRVRRMSPDGSIVTVAGRGAPGSDGDGGPAVAAFLRSPRGLAADAAGNIYIADTGNGRVRKVSADGMITTVAGIGSASLGSDSGPADHILLHSPRGMAVDDHSNLYIADTGSNRIIQVAPDRRARTVAGTGVEGFSGDGGPAEMAQLNQPQAVATDGDGNLYIADTANHRIRKVTAGGIITTVAGSGTEGFGGDGGSATEAQLWWPAGVAVDAVGNLYVSDTYNIRIRRVGADGRITTVAGGGRSYWDGIPVPATSVFIGPPREIQFDGRGNLYIVVGGIAKLTPEGILSMAAGGWSGGFSGNGDGRQAAQAGFCTVQSVAADEAGNLYIAESGGHRIRKVTLGGIIWTLAGASTGCGIEGQPGEGVPAALSRLQSPAGVAVDLEGNLYIADTGNHRVRQVPAASACFREGPPAVGSADPGIIGGKVVSITGVGLGPAEGVSGTLNSSGALDTTLAGTRALFDGIPAALLYAQYNQVNAVVPAAIVWTAPRDGFPRAGLTIEYLGNQSDTFPVYVLPAAPRVFTSDSSGWGQAAAWNEDGSLNSATNPAAKGSVVTLLATGEGATNPPREDGVPAVEPLPRPVLPVAVFFGIPYGSGVATELVDAVAAPGLIGVLQVKFRVPEDAPSGQAVGIFLRVGEQPSQGRVTIAVR